MGLVFSPHAVARFQERCRPALDLKQCEQELRRLTRDHEVLATPPEWVIKGDHTAGWVLLGPDVCLVLDKTSKGQLVAVTTMVRGSISDATRAFRKRKRIEARKRRQAARARANYKPLAHLRINAPLRDDEAA